MMFQTRPQSPSQLTRRDMLKSAGCGFGYLAFAGLCGQLFGTRTASAAPAGAARGLTAASIDGYQSPLAPKMPHFAPRAKRVIFLFMQGGPSHLDTFDYKPRLEEDAGKSIRGGALLPSPFKFERRGKSGLWISELYPHLSAHADELCVLNGMHTDNPAHPQATLQLHTGSATFVRPSVGAWALYGLGTMNQDLPGFVTINPPAGLGGAQNYGSAFLPATYQGTRVDATGIADVRNRLLPPALQRKQLDLVQSMNRDLAAKTGPSEQLEGLIESFELGFRMQGAVPELMDIAGESAETLSLYGINAGGPSGRPGNARKGGAGGGDGFARSCLMARRFAEAGVRFIEVTHPGWDQHNQLAENLRKNCAATDRAIAALITDLKRTGLFKDTLLVWGGEFGRTPGAQNNDGRNHNNRGYTMWMAGGGVKGGLAHGRTDDYGAEAVEGKVHTHDLHATILHLLGLDHERLTYRYAGRDFRLTDVYGNVVSEILA
jgi:hypothetical protein